MEIIFRPIDELKPFSKNPYIHPEKQLKYLIKSMREFGFTSPILISQDNMIIAGHARLQAAKEFGLAEVPTIFIDLPYERAVAYVIADNQLGKIAEQDDILMKELLDEISSIPDFDIEAVGFSEEEIKNLVNTEPAEIIEDNFNPGEEVETRCKEGDLWELGRHRLLCGDSTKKEDVLFLLDNKNPDFIFTDPPYGVGFNYSAYNDERGENYNKFISEIWAILKSFNCPIVLTPGNVNLSLWVRLDNFNIACWVKKNAMSPSSISHLSIFELILLYNVKKRRNTDLLEYSVKIQDGVCDHPCPKLLDVVCDCISTWGEGSKILYEPFCGSGTSIIACEQLNRTCYAMELDPHYCDVILSRWEKFTGQTAKRL